MALTNLTRALLATGLIAGVSACIPAQAQGYRTYFPDSGYYVERYPDGYYRSSDGRRFTTWYERDAYQQRLDLIAERERARLREERRRIGDHDRGRNRVGRGRDLTFEERARRRAEERRDRIERARREAERERRRALRREREAEAEERRRRAERRRERDATGRELSEREERRRQRRADERARELERRAAEIRSRNRLAPPRALPEGWTVIQKDGKTMYLDTEGRIRSGF